MKYKTAPLNHSHLPEVYAIEASSHLTPWSERIIQQSFGPRSHNVGLFRVEKKQWTLIGYFFAEHVAGEVSLENMCLAKSEHGQGLSHRLMETLVEYAMSIEAFEIWLEVRATNKAAIALYQKHGFENVSIRKSYYSIPNSTEKEDAWLMKKVLTSIS
jgi:[ribosomal protein S18]-alanine N-acetyltransferase